MFRFTRPLFNAARKPTTGITGLKVHHDPIPLLRQTYEATLQTLSAMPQSSVYRQGTEALTLHKLKALEKANGDISVLEKELDEGQVEESLDIAQDELSLAKKMLEWKAWEPLEEKPLPGQWTYFGREATATSSS
ncbi:NADH2 dehydrogenase [Trametes sanguinea]|nr:NADH2 dehydrogenase [Trametes sanguinea]